ncbi:hypothetical protein HYH03_002645 [Edaphochlamys debaryana]|uniref:DUF6816 domain-containing protein n=1 Tax=Edaphochlamys debaryana TaxID=47281 RepID=A0A835YB41_9CHLO|nr:hypothetical protein HYH03_002645 [Edaphochlamys debaryana]|eukprot:KAG2499710.1 hypothetical protein HYH03_002645 [Edaphochlamys debaryana]
MATLTSTSPSTVSVRSHQQRPCSFRQRSTAGAHESGPGPSLPRPGRRELLLGGSALLAAVAAGGPADASKLPPWADGAWEAIGGGPSDLVFPDEFLGVWDVVSVLVRLDTPLGAEGVPPAAQASVRRAQAQDLDKKTAYQVSFVRNRTGKVVYDRRFNTASMLSMYYTGADMSFQERIVWDINDPNILSLRMPGMSVRTRVTRRSEEFPADDRIETSEFVESIYDGGQPGGSLEDEGEGGPSRLKASQCYTKYKWRDPKVAAADGGPTIIATQVVSDFLTPYDGEKAYIMAGNKPYAQYTYRIAFKRHESA